MILSDTSLRRLLELDPPLLDPSDVSLVNPASIDIRVGRQLVRPIAPGKGVPTNLVPFTEANPYEIGHHEFILVQTFECINVPNGYAVDLKLKSSRAREGWTHALAFWFDPGWRGVGTMELKNWAPYSLPIWYGMKIGQIIVHKVDAPSLHTYAGKYQGAEGVELAKV